jgi:thioester reductase-like protein
VPVQGWLEEPYFGPNTERLLQLADEVSVIIHSAAITGKLKTSAEVNVAGTLNVLQIMRPDSSVYLLFDWTNIVPIGWPLASSTG